MNSKKIQLALCALMFAFGLAACNKPGPAEKAGQEIDNAAKKAGDKVEDASKKVGDKLEEAGDKVEKATDSK